MKRVSEMFMKFIKRVLQIDKPIKQNKNNTKTENTTFLSTNDKRGLLLSLN